MEFLPVDSKRAGAVVTAGAVVLIFLTGAQIGRYETKSSAQAPSLLAAPVEEAPSFTHCATSDAILSDAEFATQSWRWSAGTSAWIAVLVRVGALETIGLARIGGLYGP